MASKPTFSETLHMQKLLTPSIFLSKNESLIRENIDIYFVFKEISQSAIKCQYWHADEHMRHTYTSSR